MTWLPIPGWPLYEASDTGLIRNAKTGKIKSQRPNTNGYQRVQLYHHDVNYPRFVHLLVLEVFVGPRPHPGWEGSHKNGDRLNNAASNLAWKSKSDNEMDRVEHGTSNRGERHGNSKLTADDVREIRRLCATGQRQQDIAHQFGLAKGYVSEINRRTVWRHI